MQVGKAFCRGGSDPLVPSSPFYKPTNGEMGLLVGIGVVRDLPSVALFDGLVRVRLFGRPAVGRRAEASREVLPCVVLEQPGRADVAGEDVEALVPAHLLHLPDRRPGPGG